MKVTDISFNDPLPDTKQRRTVMVWGMKKSQWYVKPDREKMIGKSSKKLHFKK